MEQNKIIYIDGSIEMNEINQGRIKDPELYKHEFTGSIYHVIPSQVFDDERLTHGEKLFYGLISGLTHRNGYSYCKDQYFADRMKSELRVVQDWLKNLEKYGYIRRETKKVGMYWERKIYLTHSHIVSNNVYEQHKTATSTRTASRNSTNSTKLLLGTAQNCEHNIEINNIETPPLRFQKPKPDPYDPTPEEEEEISAKLKRRKAKTFLPPIEDDTLWKSEVLKKSRTSQKEASDTKKSSQSFFEAFKRVYGGHKGIAVGKNYVEFDLGGASGSLHIRIDEIGAKERIIERLKKMRLSVEGLG